MYPDIHRFSCFLFSLVGRMSYNFLKIFLFLSCSFFLPPVFLVINLLYFILLLPYVIFYFSLPDFRIFKIFQQLVYNVFVFLYLFISCLLRICLLPDLGIGWCHTFFFCGKSLLKVTMTWMLDHLTLSHMSLSLDSFFKKYLYSPFFRLSNAHWSVFPTTLSFISSLFCHLTHLVNYLLNLKYLFFKS